MRLPRSTKVIVTIEVRIDVFYQGKRVYTEAYDGSNAWQQKGDGQPVEDSGATGAATLWHGTVLPGKLFGLHEAQRFASTLELQGRESIDGLNYYVLKLTLKDGFVTYLYLNPDTWMIERTREFRALHPDIDQAQEWTESRFSDFRMVDGVMRSFSSSHVDLKTGAVLQTSTIKEIKTNPPVDDSIFRKS